MDFEIEFFVPCESSIGGLELVSRFSPVILFAFLAVFCVDFLVIEVKP